MTNTQKLRNCLLLLTAAEHHGTAADLEECLTAAEALPLPGMAACAALSAARCLSP